MEDKNLKAKTASKHSRTILLALFALFLVPIFAAWWVFEEHPTFFSRTTNHGHLIQPPLQLSDFKLQDGHGPLLLGSSAPSPQNAHQSLALAQSPPQGYQNKWLLVLFNPGDCQQACLKGLYHMRQIRIATGKNSERVQTAILTYPASSANATLSQLLASRFPYTLHWLVDKQQYRKALARSLASVDPLKPGTLFVVDPLGNVVMVYASTASATGVLQDLERLLRISQIG